MTLTTKLLALRARERGSSLIEMCMVIAIMGIIALASTTLMLGMFGSQARAQVMDQQLNEGSRILDYAKSNLESATIGDCGLTEQGNSARIEETSLAGDQIICSTSNECFRLMYIARSHELKVAITNSSDCSPISPRRGPNQMINGGYQIANAADPLFDPVLDNPGALPAGSTVFTLAEDLVLTENGSVDTANHPLFSFKDLGDSALSPTPDNQAVSSSSNGLYQSSFNLDRISAIEISGYLDEQLGLGSSVAPRLLDQIFYLNH
jgi:type II secretory pathway pseudopilin PulG